MAKTKGGKASREKIYNAAKRLFLKNGYKNTTIEQIAEEAGMLKGSVTYHFKKENFISQIYIDFYDSIMQRIEESVGSELENIFQKHIMMIRIFMDAIFDHDDSRTLYREILFEKAVPVNSPVHKHIRRPLLPLIEEMNIDISPPIFDTIMEAEYGARAHLFKMQFNKNAIRLSPSLVNFTTTMSLKMMGISKEIIDANVKKAEALLKKIDYSDLRFISVSEKNIKENNEEADE